MSNSKDEKREAILLIRELYPRAAVLTVKQMAELSGHHHETIRRWCEDGSIKTRRRQRPREAWRIPLESAVTFLVDGRRTSRRAA